MSGDCIESDDDLRYQNGTLSTFDTFLFCLDNVAGPKLLPTLYGGQILRPVDIRSVVGLNNIGDINPAAATVTIDFFLDLYWVDERLSMPPYWEKVDVSLRREGVRIERIFYDSAGSFIWLPDISFTDGLELQELGFSLSLNATNTLHWRKHYVATFSQQHFGFRQFPHDTQDVSIRYTVFSYDETFVRLELMDPPVTFVENTEKRGKNNFFMHSEWDFFRNDATSTVYLDSSGSMSVVLTLPVDRYTAGIVGRLCVPITILLLLGGATFWIGLPENRIPASASLIIAVTALYIVILANVPFVGYATRIDEYVLVMIGLLAGIVTTHVVYLVMYRSVYSSSEHDYNLTKYSRPWQLFVSILKNICCFVWVGVNVGGNEDRETRSDLVAQAKIQKAALTALSDATRERQKGSRGEENIRDDDNEGQMERENKIRRVNKGGNTSLTDHDKERNKPTLTLVMQGLQLIGRIGVIPTVLLYTAYILIINRRNLVLAFQCIAYVFLATVGMWEIWTWICKYLELSSIYDPMKDLREDISRAYVYLTCNSNSGDLKMSDISASAAYSQLLHEHIDLIVSQHKWTIELCRLQELSTTHHHIFLMIKQSELLHEHDLCRSALMKFFEYKLAIPGEEGLQEAYGELGRYMYAIFEPYPHYQEKLKEIYGHRLIERRPESRTMQSMDIVEHKFSIE